MTTETEAPASPLTEVRQLSLPDMAGVSRGAESALRMAQAFVINSDDDYALAGEELQSVKGRLKKLEETRISITGPMNKALDAINNLFRGPRQTLEAAESAIKGGMLTYHTKKEQEAAEARRVAEAAAAAERARIAEEARQVELKAAAERARIAEETAAQEAQRKAEQEKLAALAATGNEEAERQAEALRLQSMLQEQQTQQRINEINEEANRSAAAMVVAAATISAPVTHIESAKSKGTSIKATVDFEVTSLLSLVQHIAQHPELINLVVEDTTKLRAYVRGLGLNAKLPGVRVYEKKAIASRAA